MGRYLRLTAAGLLLLTACGGIPVPGESPAEFFTRCMASFGYEVTSVEVPTTIENCCGFATSEEPTAAFDRAVVSCEQALYEQFD